MKTCSVAVLAAAVIAVMGCGGEAGPQTQTGGAGAAGAVTAPATGGAGVGGTGSAGTSGGPAGTTGSAGGATGQGGGPGASSVERFVGSWKFTSGTITRICAGVTETFQLAGDDAELAHAIDGGLTEKGNCSAKLMVSGTTASAASGFSCNQVNDDGSSSTLVFSSLVYSTFDGFNMSYSAAGTVTFLSSGGSTACTFSATGALMKYAL